MCHIVESAFAALVVALATSHVAAAPVGNGIAFWVDAHDLDGDGVAEANSEAGLNGMGVETWNNKAAVQFASPVGHGLGGMPPNPSINPTFSAVGSSNGLGQVNFDGTSDHKFIGNHSDLNGASGLTIFAVATQTGGFRLLQKGNGGGLAASNYFFNPSDSGLGVAGAYGETFPVTYSSAANGDAIFASVFDESIGTNGKVYNFLNGANRGQPTGGRSFNGAGSAPAWDTDGFLLGGAYQGASNNDALYFGRRNNPMGSSGHFAGSVNELLIYNGNLNHAERIVVENYLQAKWNDSASPTPNLVIANDFYSGDTTARGNYDFNVFGIGRVDASNQLTSNDSRMGLTLSATLGDGEWAMAGLQSFDTTPFSAAVPIESTEIATGDRWDRVWFVDVTTPDALDLTLTFDFSDASTLAPNSLDEFSLLYSVTGAYDWQILDTATLGGVDNDQLMFSLAGLNGSNSGYFTIGINAQLVPESQALTLWLLAGVLSVGGVCYRRHCSR